MSSQENKENFVNKSNENQIDVYNDLSYENELIKTICYDVYSSHIEKKKLILLNMFFKYQSIQ